MEAEIWAAGADLETANFVARMLGNRGYHLAKSTEKPDTIEIGCIGPVNGLGIEYGNGPYYKLVIIPKHSARVEYLVTMPQLVDLTPTTAP